jgi:hypothetical protein
MSDVKSSKRGGKRHPLAERSQNTVPKNAAKEGAKEIEPSGRHEPKPIDVPRMLSEVFPRAGDRLANEPDDNGNDQQFDREKQPTAAIGAMVRHVRLIHISAQSEETACGRMRRTKLHPTAGGLFLLASGYTRTAH